MRSELVLRLARVKDSIMTKNKSQKQWAQQTISFRNETKY